MSHTPPQGLSHMGNPHIPGGRYSFSPLLNWWSGSLCCELTNVPHDSRGPMGTWPEPDPAECLLALAMAMLEQGLSLAREDRVASGHPAAPGGELTTVKGTAPRHWPHLEGLPQAGESLSLFQLFELHLPVHRTGRSAPPSVHSWSYDSTAPHRPAAGKFKGWVLLDTGREQQMLL